MSKKTGNISIIDEIDKSNIKYRNWNILLFLFIIVSFFSIRQIRVDREQLYESIEGDKQGLYKCIIELKNSSNDLTNFVRSYVVTGDKRYKELYYELLSIRDGNAPRPTNTDSGHWYYILSERNDREEEYLDKISLFDIMMSYGFKENEIQELKNALERSNDLVNIEKMAFDAIEGNNSDDIQNYILEGETLEDFAIRILYDKNYIDYKIDILYPLNNLLYEVENLSTDQLTENINQVKLLDIKMLNLIVLFFIILTGIILRILSLSIETRRYFEKLVNQLKDTQEEILNVLARAGEYRDDNTGNHVLRVKEYSYEIAKGLGLDKEKTHLVRDAAAMHDIGKIGIKDSILNKPGKYTEDEINIMKNHSIIGHKIIGEQNIELLDVARMIALEHHEKINGGGYPRKLKGDEISVYSKIVAIADVFDALTTKRIYKEAWSVGKTIDYIKSEKGSSFDPDVVNAFLSRLDRIVEIKEMFEDKM